MALGNLNVKLALFYCPGVTLKDTVSGRVLAQVEGRKEVVKSLDSSGLEALRKISSSDSLVTSHPSAAPPPPAARPYRPPPPGACCSVGAAVAHARVCF